MVEKRVKLEVSLNNVEEEEVKNEVIRPNLKNKNPMLSQNSLIIMAHFKTITS